MDFISSRVASLGLPVLQCLEFIIFRSSSLATYLLPVSNSLPASFSVRFRQVFSYFHGQSKSAFGIQVNSIFFIFLHRSY